MKISMAEFMDYLEVSDVVTPVVLKEGFSQRITETRVTGTYPAKLQFIKIETFVPVYNLEFQQLSFDTDDVQLFVEYEDGKREVVEIED